MKTILIFIVLIIMVLFLCGSTQEVAIPDIKEGMIKVSGGRIWYRIAGVNKTGIPLLTLHGGPGAPHDYLVTLEALADERPVIFYDQLGCGNSDKPADTSLWNIARFVEEVAQVRAALHLEKVHLLGQSWGAMLAVEYVLRKKPKGVVGLILSGPLLSAPQWIADQKTWISKLPQNIRDTISKYEENGNFASPAYQDAMMYYYRRHLCRLDPWPACLNQTMEKMGKAVYEYMWGPSEFTVTGTLKNVDLSAQLSRIKVPTLFTCGEFDEATPAATSYFQRKIAGSEIHIFKGASHGHHLEKPDEYLQVTRNFLKKCELKE